MSLDHVRRVYEEWGEKDPLYAVLTRKGREGNRWDPEEFFRTGREEVAEALEGMAGLPVRPGRDRALDFGCGVGRLSQALADHFGEVVGVDISRTMVEKARELDRHPGRVRYLVNTDDDLGALDDASFDLVYSSITLQHIPPPHQATYIGEFVRVLRPGGVAIFQVRDGPRIRPGTARAWLYRLRRQHLRRLWKRLRGRMPYEMHSISRSQVEEAVAERGGRVLEVAEVGRRRRGKRLRYYVTR